MLFARSLLVISCIAFCVKAIPIQPQISETNFLVTESLTEYYETIVDQVMLDVTEDVLFFIPDSINHEDIEARQLAQKSMGRNLNFMRASLLASINPLISTDLPQLSGFDLIQDIQDEQRLDIVLMDAISSLNKKMSHQLGLIVNAEKSSNILMKQAFNSNHSEKKPTTITVEWELRKPFQINIVHEQPKDIDITMETNWLYQQLSTIEINLLNEFEDRIEEAIQLVKESLSI